VLLTELLADEHDAATASTGGLPPQLVEGEPRWVRVQERLSLLQRHLELCGCVVKERVDTPSHVVCEAAMHPVEQQGDDIETQSVKRKRPHSGPQATGSMRKFGDGVCGLIGNTPMVELKSLSEALNCVVLGKAEFLNPGGCQKDRVAEGIVTEAIACGDLQHGGTIVEGTSGSTGISLSMVGRSKGYKVLIVMPDDQASEKVRTLEHLGAQVELVKPSSIVSGEHYVNLARQRAREIPGGFFCNQFENLANFRSHYNGTGPEIWEQTDGKIDAFVMAAGTGGTIAGVGRYLKEQDPELKVCLADPPGSSLFHKVRSGVLYTQEQAEKQLQRHRYDTVTEGIGIDRLTANFSQGLAEHNHDAMAVIDSAVQVSDQEAVDMARYLLDHEGIFVGSSAALNVAAVVKVARELGPGKVLVTILCDGGQRHMSKFHNPDFLKDFGLRAASDHARDDLSFIT